MPINILMPALSPTMEKGNLAKWLKKEGETIKAGDVIAEIETDKATMEVEAADEGVLAKIVVPEGTADVPVNQLIAVLAGEGEDVTTAAAQAGRSAPPAPPAPPSTASNKAAAAEVSPSTPASSGNGHEATTQATAAPQPALETAAPSAARTNGHGTQRVFSSPLARRLAKEAGVDIGRVQGSGPHGRVIARDIEAARAGRGLRAPAAEPAAVPSPPRAARPPTADKIRALFAEGSYEVVPHDNMRKIIAQRMVEATSTIPHFYLTLDCNLDKLLAAREEINASAPRDGEGKPAYKLSVNDFVVKALALALQKIPDANVTWTEGALLKHRHSDVGVAVAIPAGLITPVVRQAETKSLSVISREMKDFATRARVRRLKPEEYTGGTTAVSNLGMYGIKQFTAVINPPHATILAVGAGEARALVKNGAVSVATQMTVTLSCDHRAVDGALGAELISAFKSLIEQPVMMLA
jgi:pyruvate dehydrogenase E2 component (dihydrolipoamide acetyltransferase)